MPEFAGVPQEHPGVPPRSSANGETPLITDFGAAKVSYKTGKPRHLTDLCGPKVRY